ncbi:MAG: thioredoxin domain-containing protein [Desulfobacterales bacterium]|nr:thioredoxin domain-containing protein [Desulfobacterales bacterium]
MIILFSTCASVSHVYSDESEKANKLNLLAKEKSPYLLQHAKNPVNWYPWGDAAFEKARKEGKPIFLSVGYATCHWCHVMAHESFEDKEVADLLNKYFISVKVDREERPDVDKIYMSVCQAMTGRGGWPLSVFMTPEGKPFYAGTYFPKTGRFGMPGFMDLLNKLSNAWQKDRDTLIKTGQQITDHIGATQVSKGQRFMPGAETLKKCHDQLAVSYDRIWGGFGSSPKFPTPHNLTFLLRWHKRSGDTKALSMVEKTLEAMRSGGIFDQIGFGFHRYSVDEKWLVPHFEKMLYDQAMLTMAYVETYQVTGKEKFAKVAKEIFTYVLRDMTSSEGGFYSAEDADSEGKEGLFYLWTPNEINEILGKDVGGLVCRFYNITETGNFEEEASIAHMTVSPEAFASKMGIDLVKFKSTIGEARTKLFQIRKKRIHPLKDDKILTSWNGLMIAAFAKGYQALGDKTYINAAEKAAGFVLATLKSSEGRLLRRYRQGEALYPAYLDDYAFLVWGLIELYEATFDLSYLEKAIYLNNSMLDIFWDDENGGLFFTGKGNETLITRSKEVYDGAIPSGNSVAALNLMRLARMTGNMKLEKKAEQLISAFSRQATEHPQAFTQLLSAVDFVTGPGQEIVIVGDPALKATQEMIRFVQTKFMPNKVLLLHTQGAQGKRLSSVAPFVKDMAAIDNKPAVYVCEQYACKLPVTEIDRLDSVLK